MMNKLLNTFGFLFVMTSLSGQCLDEQIHNNSSNSIWMSCQSSINPLTEYGDSHWILYQFEEEQSIENMKIWNLNHHDNIVSGIKSMNVDISPDGAVWTNIGVLNLDMADGTRSYIGTEYAQLGPFRAQFVLFTAIDNYGGACFGLSEVQFNLGENTTPTRDAYLSSLINISPNPADSRFSVLLTGIKTSKYSFQVIDMTGRVLSTGGSDSYGVDQEFDIDGSHLPDGQYALRINTDEGSTIKKFIITHPN